MVYSFHLIFTFLDLSITSGVDIGFINLGKWDIRKTYIYVQHYFVNEVDNFHNHKVQTVQDVTSSLMHNDIVILSLYKSPID